MHSRGSGRTVTLDGLRGIAVLAVVIDHAWPGALPGGFAGVDVFFVLSGYLITRILVIELEATGRIGLWAFYARRVRRILPASLVTVIGTCLLYLVLLGPAMPAGMRTEALSATFSVSNFLFARTSVDYFASNPASSPFLHFWSLGVEEQFYLVWPTLLLAMSLVARRFGAWAGGRAWVSTWLPIAGVAVLGVGSLMLAVRGSEINAFFLLPHRGWELIVGGLFAWLQHRGLMVLPGRLRPYRALGVVAGYGMLAVTFAAAPDLGRWPGFATVLPVAGTALLVAGGDAMPGARILMVAPLQFFGRISYALYLWHWPLLAAAALVMLPVVAPPFWVAAIAVGLAILVSTASTILLEEPIRSSRMPALVGRRAVGTGLAGMVAVGLVVALSVGALPAVMAARDPFGESLAKARTDRERIIADSCISSLNASAKVRNCVYGRDAAPDGGPTHDLTPAPPTVVLFGDSHAMHWFPAIDAWARDQGLALVPVLRSGCPTVLVPPLASSPASAKCGAWREAALERVAALDPVLTIVSTSTDTPVVIDGTEATPRVDGASSPWVGAAAAMLAELRVRSVSVVFVGDVPRPDFNVPDCLAAHRWSPGACTLPLDTPAELAALAAQLAAASQAGVPFVDPGPWLCPADTCTWMVGDRVGWVDSHHITSSAAMSVLPELAPVLSRTIGTAR